jgi:hypothetical protein
VERSDDGSDTGRDAGEVLDAVEVEQQEAVWAAWRSLPDESRSLLWRLVVHEERPHQMAPGLGTTPSGVATLGKQARKRLRQTLLAELAARPAEPECQEARRRLGGYVRDSLPPSARHHIDDHLDGCARCRAAVLDVVDVDAAIRLRVAPALLPGAFAAAEEASVPVAVGIAPTLGGPDPEDDPGDAGDGSVAPGWATTGRVLSVPARSAAAVLAAASLILAAALLLLQHEPGGRVSAEAPVGPGSSTASGRATDDAESPHPTRGTSGAPGPVIGVATAQAVSRFQSSGGRTDNGGSAGSLERQRRSASDTTPGTSAARPTTTSQVQPSPANPSTTSSPGARTTTQPSRVGTVVSLHFAPSDQGCLAHLAAPAGWLITSVQDVRGSRVREHVNTPTSVFDGRLGASDLVVEVTRVEPDLTGALTVLFTSRSGATLPGSGSYPLR